VTFRGLCGIDIPVNQHQSHEPHQTLDPLFIDQMAIVAQVPYHLPGVRLHCFLFSGMIHGWGKYGEPGLICSG